MSKKVFQWVRAIAVVLALGYSMGWIVQVATGDERIPQRVIQ